MTVRLAAVEYGAGSPVAILHGLFGSARNWVSVAQRLAARHRVIALDARNHGASPWADALNYHEMAEDTRTALHARGYRRYALLGHSMGGKAAMVAALLHGAEVERLVVVDIAPAIYEPHHLGYVRAMRAMDLGGIERRADADARLAPFVTNTAERGFLLQNLLLENGEARWRLNLAVIEAQMPLLSSFPEMPRGTAYQGPALFLAGDHSDYLLPEHEPAVRRLFPNARIARITNAGHWLHAEQPRAFLDLVEPFLAGN